MAIPKIVMPGHPAVKEVIASAEDRKIARKAANSLMGCFDWGDTVEGSDFWSSVYSRLEQIAEDGQLR